jgi:NADH:ubiquinone oxidoreductase subunit E
MGAVDAETKARLAPILARHAGGRESLVPLLLAIQAELGWLPGPVQRLAADAVGVSPTQVFEVVSFYSFFTSRPPADHQVNVCFGTTCFVNHGARVVRALEQALGTHADGVSTDGRIGLGRTRCLGACSVAPALTVDGRIFGAVTPTRAAELAEQLRGHEPRRGPGAGGRRR